MLGQIADQDKQPIAQGIKGITDKNSHDKEKWVENGQKLYS